MRQMKAAVWDGGAQVRLVQKEVPVIEHPHEAIVKVSMAAICSSDLHILHGAVPEAKRGVTLGHEMVGTIVQCGSAVKRFAPGERVSSMSRHHAAAAFTAGMVSSTTAAIPWADGRWGAASTAGRRNMSASHTLSRGSTASRKA